MAQGRRIQRINSLLKEVISEVLQRDLKSHDLPEFITITEVETSKDLRHAKVYFSLIEDDRDKKLATVDLLQERAGAIAVLASKKVTMRYFPSLTFKLDESLDEYLKIDSLLRGLKKDSATENE